MVPEGLERQKIVLALQASANTFKLVNPENNEFLDSVVPEPGISGELGHPSSLTYYEVSLITICESLGMQTRGCQQET